jgi:nucleolar pre-ribosomal-associated protein 1
LPLPVEGSFRTAECVKAQPPSVQAVIEAVIPSLLGKQHLSKGLQHSSSLVQHLTALTLARALRKYVTTRDFLARLSAEASAQEGLQQHQDQVNGSWSQLLRDVDLEARKRLPDITVVIAFAQNSAASQALQGSVDESDNDAKARAELLTEVALRLFGLYHQAFPSTVSAIRFDVGKLLVSSASAKMEADARKLIREGSVASDVGSVASIGTVGSIGMGGGFGQSRGDVRGFDGLSQIHVIQLLSRVTTWSWAAKAGEWESWTLQSLCAWPHGRLHDNRRLAIHVSLPHPAAVLGDTSCGDEESDGVSASSAVGTFHHV